MNYMIDNELAEQLVNPIQTVMFRAGFMACREYMARFVEAQSPEIAASIRANWHPHFGDDPGPPRMNLWTEVASGEIGSLEFRAKGPNELSATVEALGVAHGFITQKVEGLTRVQNIETNL